MPPGRFRVVERGRRLEVIDTLNGAPVRRAGERETPTEAPAALLPRRTRFDGTKQWTTRAFYDNKAPRTVTLPPGMLGGQARLIAALAVLALVGVFVAAPWLLIVLALLANPKSRAALRTATTRAIDRLERGTL